jgi:nicotinamidase-related amidase
MFKSQWVDPKSSAILIMEMQRGVVGDLSQIDTLVGVVRDGNVIGNIAALVASARKVRVPVLHCQALFRGDRKGSAANSPMLHNAMKNPEQILKGSPQAEIVLELAPQPSDFVVARYHGVSPFSGTSLDITLRNLGVKTVVATGVSVNLGVFGLCLEAVNLGYSVILPRDCVAGYPNEYADMMIGNSLAQLCTVTSSRFVVAAWAESLMNL